MWVRDTIHNVGPVAVNAQDMLLQWRTDMGLSSAFNLPDYTVYRTIVKCSFQLHLSAASYTSDSGVALGAFVDSDLQVQTNSLLPPLTGQYLQKFMVWDKWFLFEAIQNSPTAATVAAQFYTGYKMYDMKTRRKLGLTDSVWFIVQPTGNVILDQFDLWWNILVRVPG
jgi:hypothetical protein